jgi:hypothetical protein
MNRQKQLLVFSGIGLLTIVLLILLASPDMIFSPTITVIGSDLNKSSTNQVSVTTLTDLGDPAQMAAFPYDIGKWHGRDYDTTAVAKALGANVVLLRGYDPDTFTQPLFLTIVQSKADSSFHAPDYCFNSQGYKIQENTKESVVVTNPDWSRNQSTIEIPLNKLIVTRDSPDGKIIERSVVLYFYVKGNQFYSDMITMVEMQGLAPIQGSYEGTLNEEKEFISQITPLLFQPGKDSGQPLFTTLGEKGGGGYAVIALMLIIPVALIVFPFLRRRGNAK